MSVKSSILVLVLTQLVVILVFGILECWERRTLIPYREYVTDP